MTFAQITYGFSPSERGMRLEQFAKKEIESRLEPILAAFGYTGSVSVTLHRLSAWNMTIDELAYALTDEHVPQKLMSMAVFKIGTLTCVSVEVDGFGAQFLSSGVITPWPGSEAMFVKMPDGGTESNIGSAEIKMVEAVVQAILGKKFQLCIA